MKRKYSLVATLSLIIICVCSCGTNSFDAIEYHQICSEANKDSPIRAKGFLYLAEKVPCLKIINPQRDCAVKLLDKINVVNDEVVLNLPEGKGKNQLETPEIDTNSAKPSSIFPREQVKVRFNDDSIISQSAETATPVIIEGTVRIKTQNDDRRGCIIDVTKIEKSS